MSAPKPPDPTQVANTQAQYNKKAQQQSMIGQAGPYGGLSWTPDPTQPGGFTATQYMSPQELALLNLQITGQTGAGTAAAGLGGQLAGLYGQPANIDPSAMTKQLMDWQTQYMQPYWNQQISNQTAGLANQGITPGSQAYNNAMQGLYSGIGNARNAFFGQAEPLAFSQALQQYELPLQTFGTLQGMSQPQQQSYVPTPGVQPPDYQQAAMQSAQMQAQNYQNMIKSGAMLAGAIAGAPFTGGTSLFGALPSIFSGGWASSPSLVGGQF